MSDCKEIREKLSAFIDNELPYQERSLIKRHLDQCPTCSEEESTLRKVTDLLAAIPDEKPAAPFASLTVHRAASWKRCAYVKEHLYRPAVAFALSVMSLAFYAFYPESGSSQKRRYPAYRYLRNFDDFPPESLSSVYIALIEGEYR